MRYGDWLQDIGGGAFWPLDPRPEDIHIESIAHALSMQCRYGGHVRHFYSVAEHCVLLAMWAPAEAKRWALLHDASEAYLVDVPRPVKAYLTGYAAAEARLMAAVVDRFGLEPGEPAIVKEGDRRILLTERAALMGPPPMPWAQDGLEPLPVTIRASLAELLDAADVVRRVWR